MNEEPCDEKHPFSAERFFRWRCWWDYGTGLSGDLLTHEYDAINQILGMGIPESAYFPVKIPQGMDLGVDLQF